MICLAPDSQLKSAATTSAPSISAPMMNLFTKTTQEDQSYENTLKPIDNEILTKKIMRRVSIENKSNINGNGVPPAAHQKQQPYFYSINAMVPQQELECWDNSNTSKMPSSISMAKPQQQHPKQKQQRAPKKLSAEFNISSIDEQHSSPGVRCTALTRSNSSRSVMMSRQQSVATSRTMPPKSILRRANSERAPASIATPSASMAAPSPACNAAASSACRTLSAIKATQGNSNRSLASDRSSANNITTTQPPTRPSLTRQQSQQSVHFPPSSSMITATHVRPRTNSDEVSELYYSNQEIRRNKRERALRQLNEKKAWIVAEQKEALKNGTLFPTSATSTTAATSTSGPSRSRRRSCHTITRSGGPRLAGGGRRSQVQARASCVVMVLQAQV